MWGWLISWGLGGRAASAGGDGEGGVCGGGAQVHYAGAMAGGGMDPAALRALGDGVETRFRQHMGHCLDANEAVYAETDAEARQHLQSANDQSLGTRSHTAHEPFLSMAFRSAGERSRDAQQFLIAETATTVYVACRGSQTVQDWLTNSTAYSAASMRRGQVHAGFDERAKQFNAKSVLALVVPDNGNRTVENSSKDGEERKAASVSGDAPKSKQGSSTDGSTARVAEPKQLVITGHSLGGAVAQLLALHCKAASHNARVLCITFAAPAVGDQALRNFVYHQGFKPDFVNIVVGQDPVPGIFNVAATIAAMSKRVDRNLLEGLVTLLETVTAPWSPAVHTAAALVRRTVAQGRHIVQGLKASAPKYVPFCTHVFLDRPDPTQSMLIMERVNIVENPLEVERLLLQAHDLGEQSLQEHSLTTSYQQTVPMLLDYPPPPRHRSHQSVPSVGFPEKLLFSSMHNSNSRKIVARQEGTKLTVTFFTDLCHEGFVDLSRCRVKVQGGPLRGQPGSAPCSLQFDLMLPENRNAVAASLDHSSTIDGPAAVAAAATTTGSSTPVVQALEVRMELLSVFDKPVLQPPVAEDWNIAHFEPCHVDIDTSADGLATGLPIFQLTGGKLFWNAVLRSSFETRHLRNNPDKKSEFGPTGRLLLSLAADAGMEQPFTNLLNALADGDMNVGRSELIELRCSDLMRGLRAKWVEWSGDNSWYYSAKRAAQNMPMSVQVALLATALGLGVAAGGVAMSTMLTAYLSSSALGGTAVGAAGGAAYGYWGRNDEMTAYDDGVDILHQLLKSAIPESQQNAASTSAKEIAICGLKILQHTETELPRQSLLEKIRLETRDISQEDGSTIRTQVLVRDDDDDEDGGIEIPVPRATKSIIDRLASVCTLHRIRTTMLRSRSVAVFGMKNAGKSSLVRQLWGVRTQSGATHSTQLEVHFPVSTTHDTVLYDCAGQGDLQAQNLAESCLAVSACTCLVIVVVELQHTSFEPAVDFLTKLCRLMGPQARSSLLIVLNKVDAVRDVWSGESDSTKLEGMRRELQRNIEQRSPINIPLEHIIPSVTEYPQIPCDPPTLLTEEHVNHMRTLGVFFKDDIRRLVLDMINCQFGWNVFTYADIFPSDEYVCARLEEGAAVAAAAETTRTSVPVTTTDDDDENVLIDVGHGSGTRDTTAHVLDAHADVNEKLGEG